LGNIEYFTFYCYLLDLKYGKVQLMPPHCAAEPRIDDVPIRSLAAEKQIQHFRRMREIEEILVMEYEARRTDFARTQDGLSSSEEVGRAFESYILSIRRLRHFLAEGEIPYDLSTELPLEGNTL